MAVLVCCSAVCLATTAQAQAPDDQTKPEQTEATKPAETDSQPADSKAETLQGHSYHGEVFNEGPRQAAYLMDGMPKINFPATTSSTQAQQFINQGVAQLHGFWYYEAERSFRQAAKLDPECAIAYWGMAMANIENLKRARGFLDQVKERKSKASRREQMYIDAFEKFCRETEADGKKIPNKTRAQKYTEGLEEIVLEFPEDIEAKSFLAVQLWANERNDLPITGHVAINALLQQIFDAAPMHPSHHYRIHLWDRKKAEHALASAAQCGPSSPGIAHMWHMPGHIYSKLHRYHDACWQQEASARVDHAHMIRDRVMPDQIHNFAHNNEWLIRNMMKVGRVHDAVSLAKNMIELPRHTKYNSAKKTGSSKYGRERLYQTLYAFQLWDQLIELSNSAYLPDVADDEELHLQWSRYLGVAQALGRGADAAQPTLDELNQRQEKIKKSLAELDAQAKASEAEKPAKDSQEQNKPNPTAPPTDSLKSDSSRVAATSSADTSEAKAQPESTPATAAANPSTENSPGTAPENTPENTSTGQQPTVNSSGRCEAEANEAEQKKKDQEEKKKQEEQRKKLQESQRKIDRVISSIKAAQCAAQQRWFEAIELAKKGDDLDYLTCEWQMASGNYDKAIEAARKKVKDLPGEILPLALVSWIEYQHGGSDAAKESFERVRALTSQADVETPPLRRLSWLASALGYSGDWRLPYKAAGDIGARPDLDSLGPYRWHPYQLPEFVVKDVQGQEVRSSSIDRPTLVIFYLGFGCLHCVEQLKAFSPRVAEISNQGINLIAISRETPEEMTAAIKNYDKPLEIPLHTDPQFQAFKALRCFDDFENQPLHGLFLINPGSDGKPGKVLWQDIGFEPFMDVDFVLKESQRLLQLSK
jgi:peroxiredoxin